MRGSAKHAIFLSTLRRRGGFALAALLTALAGCHVVDADADIAAARATCGLTEGQAHWARPGEGGTIIFAEGLSEDKIDCVFRESRKFPLGRKSGEAPKK